LSREPTLAAGQRIHDSADERRPLSTRLPVQDDWHGHDGGRSAGFDGQGAGADGLLFVLQKAGATAARRRRRPFGYATAADGSGGICSQRRRRVRHVLEQRVRRYGQQPRRINVNGSVFSVQAQNVPGLRRRDRMDRLDRLRRQVSSSARERVRRAPALPTLSREIDIVRILRSPTALAGFTSATGLDFENADVLNWTYSSCPQRAQQRH